VKPSLLNTRVEADGPKRMSLVEFSRLHLKSLIVPPMDAKGVEQSLRDEDKYAAQVVLAMSKLRD
jgi:hypothetical protein